MKFFTQLRCLSDRSLRRTLVRSEIYAATRTWLQQRKLVEFPKAGCTQPKAITAYNCATQPKPYSNSFAGYINVLAVKKICAWAQY